MKHSVLITLLLVVFTANLPLSTSQQCVQNPVFDTNPPVQSGVSSWFSAKNQAAGGPSTGACNWIVSNTDVMVAAYTAPTSAQECPLCGNCYNVTGPAGSAVVRVIDYCDTENDTPGVCGPNVTPQWTLNDAPFVIIAGSTSLGSVPVTWYGPVACPMYSPCDNLTYTALSDSSNPWYVNIRVSGQRYPLEVVQFQAGDGLYHNISRYHGNQWYYNPGLNQYSTTGPQKWPFGIRVIDTLGNVVQDTVTAAEMANGGNMWQGTGGNFPDPGFNPGQQSCVSASPSPVAVPSQSSTGTPSPTPSASTWATSLSSLTVYGDSLASGWSSWSWASAFSFSNTNPVCTGSNSISYTPSGYDAIYLVCSQCFSTSYYGISFYIDGGNDGGQTLQVQVVDQNFNQIGGAFYIPSPTPNTCALVTVSFNALGLSAGTTLSGFWIQSLQGSRTATPLYIDQITILATPSSTAISFPPISHKRDDSQTILAAMKQIFPEASNSITVVSTSGGSAGTTVSAVGLSQDQVNKIQNIGSWVSQFNQITGANVTASSVGVQVKTAVSSGNYAETGSAPTGAPASPSPSPGGESTGEGSFVWNWVSAIY